MKHVKLGWKLFFLVALAVAGFLVNSAQGLFMLKDNLLDDRKLKTRHVVETTIGILQHFQAEAAAGRMSEADAKAAAIAMVRGLRYEGQEYFFITDYQAVALMHPIKPEFEGRDMSDLKDPDGVAIFAEMAKVGREQGQGFVAYRWPKPGRSEPVGKISYVKAFPEWQWVLGSGIYVDDVDDVFWQGATRQALVAGTGLALLILFAFYLSHQIVGPVQRVQRVMESLAEGDLTVRAETDARDEIGLMLQAAGRMVERLRTIIGEVRGSAEALVHASNEVSATSSTLSQAASEQAASIEETSASIEEMSSSIDHNKDNAQLTEKISTQATADARIGGETVTATVGAMKQIANKIGIVDEIAYQTNLLALNAAIEAARAGDHGKGFAVVASEVRKLAERSQNAAQEIGELAERSVAQAESAGKLFAEMLPSIEKTASLVKEIAAASEEQTIGSAQINQAIAQVNQTTQHNASASEELAATAEELHSQAESLKENISFFRLP
jgi:methyl-accepting chemotaxis protein